MDIVKTYEQFVYERNDFMAKRLEELASEMKKHGMQCFGHMGSVTVYDTEKKNPGRDTNKVICMLDEDGNITWDISFIERLKMPKINKELLKKFGMLKKMDSSYKHDFI